MERLILKRPKYKNSGFWLVVILLLYHSFFSTSLLPHLIGLTSLTVLVALNFILIALLLVFYNRSFKAWAIILSIITLVFTSFKVLNFGEIMFYKVNIYLILTFLILSIVKNNEIVKFIEIASKILLVILIGAIIAIILFQIGLPAIFSYLAPNGRMQYFYYTSFGHPSGVTLRPSGIFDEPGTLSFMLAGILTLRHIFNLNQKRTLLLLFLGFSSLSLAYTVFAALFVFSLNLKSKDKKNTIIFIISFFLIAIFTGFLSIFEMAVLGRVSIDQNSIQVTGGRQTLMETAQYNLASTKESYLWGVEPYCTIINEKCLEKGYMGENPLAPIAYHGIFIAWPYYLFLILSVFISLKGRKYVVYLALMSIFLQRPYLLNYGVCLLGILPIYLYFNNKNLIQYKSNVN